MADVEIAEKIKNRLSIVLPCWDVGYAAESDDGTLDAACADNSDDGASGITAICAAKTDAEQSNPKIGPHSVLLGTLHWTPATTGLRRHGGRMNHRS